MIAMSERPITVRLRALVDDYRQKMGQAGADTKAFGGRVLDTAEKNKQAFTTLGIAAAAAGAATLAGLASSAKAFSGYEADLTKVVSLVGVARDQVEEWHDELLQVGPGIGRGPRELGDALFFVTSAGLRGAAALDAVTASGKAASIGLGETKVVADVSTSAVNAYGAANLSASAAVDVLIGTVREGKAEAPELAGAMGRVLPIAAEMGVAFHEVGAATAAMTRTGTDAQTSTTQLRAILISLLKPAADSEAALTELGLSSAGLREQIKEKGLFSALQSLRTAIGDNDEAMARIFPNVRALAGVLDLMGGNVAENERIFARMTDTTGLLDDAFDEWSGTTEAAFARFSAASEAAKISAGEELGGALRTVLGIGTSLAEVFVDLPGPVRTVAVGVAAAAGAVLLLAGASLLALPRIAAMRTAMVTLGMSGGFVRAGLGSAVGFMTGPLGIALTAATIGLTLWAQSAAKARARVEELTEAVKADSGAIGENTRLTQVNNLEKDGVLKNAEKLGISTKLVTDAVLGDAKAQRELTAELDKANQAIDRQSTTARSQLRDVEGLRGTVNGLTGDLEEGTAAYKRQVEAMGETEGAAQGTAGALGHVGDEAGDSAADLDKMSDAATTLASALATLSSPTTAFASVRTAMEEAERASAEAQANEERRRKTIAEAETRFNEDVAEAAKSRDREIVESQQMRADDAERGLAKMSSAEDGYAESVEAAEKRRTDAIERANGDSEASWKDFVREVELSLADYAAALEEQNSNILDWRDNLVTVAARAGADVAVLLADMGTDGVELVAKMADGTDEETARMAEALRENGRIGADDFAVALETGLAVAAEKARQGADATVESVAEALNEGRGAVVAAAHQLGLELPSAILEGFKAGLESLPDEAFSTPGFSPEAHLTNPPPPARAHGGTTKAGMAYTVGELGRETFVAPADGRILSRADSMVSGASGGSSVSTGSAMAGGITIQHLEVRPIQMDATSDEIVDAIERKLGWRVAMAERG